MKRTTEKIYGYKGKLQDVKGICKIDGGLSDGLAFRQFVLIGFDQEEGRIDLLTQCTDTQLKQALLELVKNLPTILEMEDN